MDRLNNNHSQPCLRTWMFYVVSALFICLLLSVGKLQAAEQHPTEAITDLRILVDVSGSMKKNDPNNLRRDALRLLIGMLPESSRVGIWSFGQYVNMQVKPGFATKAWKNNARKEANTIRSLGLFTNIEDTLTKSSWDWKRPDPKWDRHIILLTDGMVDISKDPGKNEKSRKNILGKIVSDLASANVKIHTIALSKQADHTLLKKLSKKTGGWYEPVESADRLQRLFLRLFEKTNKMGSLPLEGNLFDVDDSITDMTLLVFRSRSGKPTKVLAPDHSVLAYGKPAKNVEWFKDKGFDIITVHKPMVGKWKLDADVDKDNRVKIISNLKLRVEPLPIDIIENESVKLKASITTKEGLLNDKEMLSLIKVLAQTTGYKGNEVTQQIPSSGADGKYEALLEGVGEKGIVQVVVKVTSPTFKRESRYEIKVHENPIKLKLLATEKGLVIRITEDPLLLQTGTLQLALRVDANKGAYYITKFGAHRWQATLDNSLSGRAITIDATANQIGNIVFKSQLHGILPEAIKPIKDLLTIWPEETASGLVIKAILEENILQTGTLQLAYFSAENKEQSVTIKQQTDKVWQQLLLPEYTGKELTVVARGYLLNGKMYEKDYKVLIPALKVKEPTAEAPIENEHADKEEHKEAAKEDEHAKQAGHDENKDEHAPEEETSITLVIILLVVSNIIIFGGAYFGYRYWRKKNQPLVDDFDGEGNDKTSDSLPNLEKSADKISETEPPVENKDGNEKDDEDFSAQRKEPSSPEDVELNVESESEESDETSDEAALIDTASADDLPDFDVDMESDTEKKEDSAKEKENE